jgi:mannosyltransferase OCH1-like enzyme
MIPRIIHQSWKVEQVPEPWLAFQKSWRDNHPGFEYRFWTDDANRAFVAREFPEFLAVYDGYRHSVSRADLARYLVVSCYGGVYVDLDCESLRPIDDLLDGRELVFGFEPQSHASKPAVRSRGLSRIVGNALFASVPHHPFWKHLLRTLIASKDEANVLEAAGPFVLTRACNSYPHPQEISIVPSEQLYPLDHFLQPTEESTKDNTADAPYAIHHWAGTWWRSAVINNAWHRINAARAATDSRQGR